MYDVLRLMLSCMVALLHSHCVRITEATPRATWRLPQLVVAVSSPVLQLLEQFGGGVCAWQDCCHMQGGQPVVVGGEQHTCMSRTMSGVGAAWDGLCAHLPVHVSMCAYGDSATRASAAAGGCHVGSAPVCPSRGSSVEVAYAQGRSAAMGRRGSHVCVLMDAARAPRRREAATTVESVPLCAPAGVAAPAGSRAAVHGRSAVVTMVRESVWGWRVACVFA